MKLTCIRDTTRVKKGIPLINRTEVSEKIKGITKEKTYTAVLFTDVHGSSTSGTGSTSTSLRFLVFNDNEEWETYHPDCFAPEEK